MKVLINSYACAPGMGSEPGLGWNWCVNLAKYCELFIITEEEFKEKIEKAVLSLPQGKNMHFYYNPVSEDVRKMCWNQGDWRFYLHYKKWQKRTLDLARQICDKEKIDIIHHLNMTGFREPGYLWKIQGPKYVWGPIGGMNLCPLNYIKDIDRKTATKYYIKNKLSRIQLRFDSRVEKAAKRADLIFCDGDEGVKQFKRVFNVDSLQINESGCHECGEIVRDKIVGKDTMDILWVGRFIPTKLLDIALKSVAIAKPNSNIKLHILGSGNLEKEYKTTAESLGVMDLCVWHGQVPHDEVQRIMRSCDLLFYTSIVDGTPASIMECISNGLPILCFDTCGFGPMVDESIGTKIQLSNPDQSVREFAEKIQYLYENRSVLQQMSDNCKEKISKISWDALAKRIVGLYKGLLDN